MDKLLEKSNIDNRKLTNFLKTITTRELSNLSEPCYYPQIRRYKTDLYKYTNLNKNDIKDFIKRFYKGTKWSRFQLHNDDYSNLLIFIMYYYLKNNDKSNFLITIVFYNIRQYSNVLHKMIKFCNEEIFKYALENISNNHLFKREKTIGNSLYFLSSQYSKQYSSSIKNKDVDKIGKFVQESRHRINQSLKSFATIYYDTYEQNKAFKSPTEFDGEEIDIPIERGKVLIDKFINKMTVYKQYDKEALKDSVKDVNIKRDMSYDIIKELADTKYNEHLTIILRLLLNRMKDLDTICSDEFKEHVKKLMVLKRTREKIYFKQQINILLTVILRSINELNNYNNLTSSKQFSINLFLSYYISLSFRNYICG